MPKIVSIVVPVFLAAEFWLVHWQAGAERLPEPPDFSRIPAECGEWRKLSDTPTDPEVVRQLGADRILNANYAGAARILPVNLFVAWFQSQRGGASQPHSPQVCLPAGGWTPENQRDVTLTTTAGTITVEQLTAYKGASRAAIVYWYQSGERTSAGEWASKFWTIVNALRYRRTDTSLVRVVVWADGGSSDPALAARKFAAAYYPRLCELFR